MGDYYRETLSAERLKRCYDIAPPRAKQYLQAELDHVLTFIRPEDRVLELGCGYGRVLGPLARKARQVIGVDTSRASLNLGRKMLRQLSNCQFLEMNAVQLRFPDQFFDRVVCIQNGISAFHVNQRDLVREAVRVTRTRGMALFSSYSDRFWDVRLEWFRLQSELGLVGELDPDRTGNGVIACRDGFTGTAVRRDRFRSLVAGLDVRIHIHEVDRSSLFCEITPTRPPPRPRPAPQT